MEREVLKYIYLDFLIDPREPKKFSGDSSESAVKRTLEEYFDQAMDRKGFNYKKTNKYSDNPKLFHRPANYTSIKTVIVREVAGKLLSDGSVFFFEEHPLFGRKCQVDSARFVSIIHGLKVAITLVGNMPLDQDIRRWGVSRFKDGLVGLYNQIGGFFDPTKWVDFDSSMNDAEQEVVQIPMHDEIVVIDKESPQIVEIGRRANELVQQLQTGNDIGGLSPEEASAAVTEVKQIITAFQGSRVRSRETYEFAKKTLSWIAEKGSEALVGVMATSLLALIAAYFGFQL